FLWENPLPIFSHPNYEAKPQIITSRDNSVIIAWEGSRTDEVWSDLYAQKVSVNGELLWDSLSVQIAAAPYYQQHPRMIDDANGGCFIVWDDSRGGNYPNVDVYAQHVLANGSIAWQENGQAVCTAPGEQSGSTVVMKNGHLFVSWGDYRTGSCSIYYQVLNLSGVEQLENNGKLIFQGLDGDAVKDETLLLKRANDVAVVWTDTRAANFGYQIYFQIVEQDGTLLMPVNGKPVTTFTGEDQLSPSAVVTANDEIAIVWSERISVPNTNDHYKIHAQLLSSNGDYLWGNSGIEIAQSNSIEQTDPKISYEDGYFYIGWSNSDSLSADTRLFRIWGQKFNLSGQALWGANGKLISGTPTGQNPTECLMQRLVGRYFVWLSQDKLYAKLVDATTGSGVSGWNPEGNISTKYNAANSDYLIQLSPMASAVSDGLVVVWEDFRVDWIKNLYAQKYNSDGSLAWDSLGVVVGDYGREQDQASLLISDGIYIPWRECIDGYTQDIAIQKLSLDGEHLWEPQGTFVIQRPNTQSEPSIAQLDNDNLLVAWADEYDLQNDIYMRRIKTDGTAEDDDLGYLVCNAPYCQSIPQIVPMGNDRAFILWNDARSSGVTEIEGLYMQFVDYSSVANHDLVTVAPIAALYDNYPNPFNPETTIQFSLQHAGKAKLEIFNIKGQMVRTLVDDALDAGIHKIIWNGKNQDKRTVGSGVYFYRLTTCNQSMTKKMILMK
ncbi:MAG TPA: T9SS type A sorting domain-containing protein, partial [Candidatus Cloacimonadota bacterium]|nr:T9SS type A sorting domain-containing protein [Candidatus Cloacimonadota bacterium]